MIFQNSSAGVRPSSWLVRSTIGLIALVQVIIGLVFLFSPASFAQMLGLQTAPVWTDWMFSQLGARALGFAFGMIWALRDLRRNASWLMAMIGVQVIDWVWTLLALQAGKVTLAQVSSAAFLPVLFVVVLALELRRLSRP